MYERIVLNDERLFKNNERKKINSFPLDFY